MHRRPVYIYLLNVPSFSSRYFNKIKRTSRLGRLLALSLEILVTFVIEKMKLASFSLFLDAFPPRPKMPFGQLNVAIQIYNIFKGRLGSRGGRGCISERRHHISDKHRPLCKMVV